MGVNVYYYSIYSYIVFCFVFILYYMHYVPIIRL